MNAKSLVRLSNFVGTISIILLIYWVFVFIAIQVFGLKVFRENLTETFYLSVLGILALMIGALIINVMFNLTRIAQKHNQDEISESKPASGKIKWAFVLSFPVVFALLYGGDYMSSKKKENLLIEAAKAVIDDNAEKANKLANYSFDEKWILETKDILEILSKTDESFPYVTIIVKDTMDNSKVLLVFKAYWGGLNDTIQPLKKDFLLETNKEERDYLNEVFEEHSVDIRFSAHDGSYELYHPYTNNNKTIVLYFSDFQRYGKIGS